jgi:hypothetical protein
MVTDEEVSSYSQYSIVQEPLPRRGGSGGDDGWGRLRRPRWLSLRRPAPVNPNLPYTDPWANFLTASLHDLQLNINQCNHLILSKIPLKMSGI